MFTLSPFLVLFAASVGGQDTIRFTDASLGLSFAYPKVWTTEKKTKDATIFSFPIRDSDAKATVEIGRVPFRSEKDTWQTIQLRVNEQLHRTVVRQWEQEVLQVPLLLTQVAWNDRGTEKTALTGLLYNRSNLKMLVKLTAPTAQFTLAENQYFETLQSLRTLDGSDPKEDDPTVKIDPPKPKAPAPPKIKILDGNGPKAKLVLPPVEVPVTVSTKNVKVRLPEGWQGDSINGGTLTLKSPSLGGVIRVEVRSMLDSEPPVAALFKLSAVTLSDFVSVKRREDTGNVENASGCRVTTIWRTGKGKSGDLLTHESSGVQGQFYFLLTYRQTDATRFKVDQAVVRSLLGQICLESSAE